MSHEDLSWPVALGRALLDRREFQAWPFWAAADFEVFANRSENRLAYVFHQGREISHAALQLDQERSDLVLEDFDVDLDHFRTKGTA